MQIGKITIMHTHCHQNVQSGICKLNRLKHQGKAKKLRGQISINGNTCTNTAERMNGLELQRSIRVEKLHRKIGLTLITTIALLHTF